MTGTDVKKVADRIGRLTRLIEQDGHTAAKHESSADRAAALARMDHCLKMLRRALADMERAGQGAALKSELQLRGLMT